jgi:hypothetical protein
LTCGQVRHERRDCGGKRGMRPTRAILAWASLASCPRNINRRRLERSEHKTAITEHSVNDAVQLSPAMGCRALLQGAQRLRFTTAPSPVSSEHLASTSATLTGKRTLGPCSQYPGYSRSALLAPAISTMGHPRDPSERHVFGLETLGACPHHLLLQ